jgi:hypothetical protein
MSQLQGLAAVTGLVVAYNSCAVAYQSWIQQTNERWDDEYNQALDRSFLAGGSEIQYEYENHLSRLGPRFSSGDCTPSFTTLRISLTLCQAVASSQLAQCLLQIQQIGDLLQSEATLQDYTYLPSSEYILSVSESTRYTVVGILRDLYDRLAFDGPLPQSFVSPHHRSPLRGSVAAETQRDLVRRRPRSSDF